MADYLQRWSKERNLVFESFGTHDAWEIRLGDGPRRIGFVMHADVVPAGDLERPLPKLGEIPPGWTQAPFEAAVVQERLYGRGTEDDKGPIAAVLVVLAAMKRFGVRPSGQLLAIIGTGEESNWTGMVNYSKTSQHPEHVISIDAGFPVVVAEAGFVAWKIGARRAAATKIASSDRARAVSATGGQFLTQVPGEASLVLSPPTSKNSPSLIAKVREIADRAIAKLGPEHFRVEVSPKGSLIEIRALGNAVHSSTAEEGHNALWLLSTIAAELDLEQEPIAQVLEMISGHFSGDHFGQRLGLAYSHPEMKPLLVIPTVLRVSDEEVSLAVNMRRPAGMTAEAFRAKLTAALTSMSSTYGLKLVELEEPYVGEAAMADTEGPLVETLLDIYRQRTGDAQAGPISIRGGTYARLFPGAVSFGPAMPGRPYRGHAPDEYIDLDVLDGLVQMLFESSVRLGTTPH
jgi:predicted dipeptidase